jgi:hypothetical protein
MSDQLPFGDARREAIERKLLALGFTSYQQFAEACAALLLQEHPTFVHAVRAACHLESDAGQMTWIEPGKDTDGDDL